MNYQQAIHYIESLQRFGIKLGLDRVAKALKRLGNPHQRYSAIHIAGTNGKGSVAAMLHSILGAAGLKVGLYTSPHLLSYSERIRVGKQEISKKEFAYYVTQVKRRTAGIRLTEFEVLTLAAFKYFADQRVDLAVLEVGLGGRLDATNVCLPLVSVITNIELDHTQRLGKTLGRIAGEKAGIIKSGVPVVTAEGKREPLKVIRRVAAQRGASLHIIRGDERREIRDEGPAFVRLRRTSAGRRGTKDEIRFTRYDSRDTKYESPLRGSFQESNLALVMKTLEVLGDRLGFCFPSSAFRVGLARTVWPGRFQVYHKNPLVILDGAHNPAAATALISSLRQETRRKIIFVVGILADKDIRKMLAILSRLAKIFIYTKPDHPRAASPQVLARESRKLRVPIKIADSVKEGLKLALRLASKSDVICVTGSLFTVAEVLRMNYI